MKRIRWGKELTGLIWDRGAELFYEHKQSGITAREALEQAQAEMAPPHMHRDFTSNRTDAARFSKFARLETTRTAALARLAALAAPVPAPPHPNPDPNAELLANMRQIADFFAQSVAVAIEKALAPLLPLLAQQTQRPSEQLARPISNPVPPAVPVPVHLQQAARLADATHRPKIMVVSNGEHTRSRDDVARAFPAVDFRWINCDDLRQIEKMSERVDCSFVMARFVNHHAQQMVKGKCILVPSGTGSLKQAITKHFGRFPGAGYNGSGVRIAEF